MASSSSTLFGLPVARSAKRIGSSKALRVAAGLALVLALEWGGWTAIIGSMIIYFRGVGGTSPSIQPMPLGGQSGVILPRRRGHREV